MTTLGCADSQWQFCFWRNVRCHKSHPVTIRVKIFRIEVSPCSLNGFYKIIVAFYGADTMLDLNEQFSVIIRITDEVIHVTSVMPGLKIKLNNTPVKNRVFAVGKHQKQKYACTLCSKLYPPPPSKYGLASCLPSI